MSLALADAEARRAALTAIDRSLLVEAGAGSGKTSVMAGRVAVLLASGVEPKHIAAITFTELAASELRERIERFTARLAAGQIPRELAVAFPDGLTAAHAEHLAQAVRALGELACTTIHGFAQRLIAPYPAEAGIDPGAGIIEPAEAALAFQEIYERWVREHLSGSDPDDVIGQLVLADEKEALELVRKVAEFLVANRDAKPAKSAWSAQLVQDLSDAAQRFERELRRFDFADEETAAKCEVFVQMVAALAAGGATAGPPTSRQLVEALQLPRSLKCFTKEGGPRKIQGKGKWEAAAKAAGRSKSDGEAAFQAAAACYGDCHAALAALQSAVAGELLGRLATEMGGLRSEWESYKRGAALLDFGDLLYNARDLLRDHPAVRDALTKRYTHVLVDEFQDTDPLQVEILWLLCAEAVDGLAGEPLRRALRPGALFLVGDPKQAIYRFRGADVAAYVEAREALGGDALLRITTNFRSVEPILSFVNGRFEAVLAESAGQPGFTKLSPFRAAQGGSACVLALDVAETDGRAGALRDAEADCIAELCSRIAGNLTVHDPDSNELRKCRYGDIALLAPTGTDLWRFEEALEARGIPVSTQAGKGLFRRQEIQDLIAIARVLADSRDTLALGALLRGPLVGLTEAELLDIAESLPVDPERPGRLPMLSISTDPAAIAHPLARSVIETLASLRRRSRTTTPYALLSDAAAALNVRAHLRQRFRAGAERALANVDLFLEMARAWDVRGLRAFALAMRANWEEAERQAEGRPDAQEESVSLITIHSAKGLEWPIVIPVNMTGDPQADRDVLHDRRSGLFTIPVLGTEPAGHDDVKDWSNAEREREHVRLCYVAATRARDFLVLPRHGSALGRKCWAKIVDFGLPELEALDPAQFEASALERPERTENPQTREAFAAEAARIAAATRRIQWRRPSRHENAEADPHDEPAPVFDDMAAVAEATEIPVPVAGSTARGILLHKLMEEVLAGETDDDAAALEARALELVRQLGIEPAADPASGIVPAELAATVVRTLALPQVRELRPRLVPELPVFASATDEGAELLVSGVADAVAVDGGGRIEVVVDWKSDVTATAARIEHYRRQVGAYRDAVSAQRALLVMMTAGAVIEA